MDTEWMARGNCAHEPPAMFFPSDGVGVEVARRICATCPVKEPCLEHALLHRIDHGVWGGCSERERRRILKRRRVASLTAGPAAVTVDEIDPGADPGRDRAPNCPAA
jgi:WhiB family transcriptional regulator, redox-sensing transcriptional regulator